MQAWVKSDTSHQVKVEIASDFGFELDFLVCTLTIICSERPVCRAVCGMDKSIPYADILNIVLGNWGYQLNFERAQS